MKKKEKEGKSFKFSEFLEKNMRVNYFFFKFLWIFRFKMIIEEIKFIPHEILMFFLKLL